ncbi:MAG: gliding motility-associated C-terminal domain-containing protein [Flavobacteriales bacterium]|nr:gliding motility-associated C-terminal domain-containing protein [Flavobacteriales bacterium]
MRTLLIFFFLAYTSLVFAQNDNCSGSIIITPTFTNCTYIAGTSANTTQSLPSCSAGGNADDDVWYSFVANSSSTTITVDPSTGYDAVIELYSGNCGLLSSIQCEDVNGLNGNEVLVNTGLINGNTYFFRVFHYGIGSGSSTFNICVFGLAPPTNNTPCNAFPLPTVAPSCNFDTYTNLGSAGSGVGTPSACGGSSPFQGGYLGGDVWFSVIVPPSGELDIHTLSIDFADGAMALYSGSCSSLVLVECDDDDGVGIMPYIYSTGLTPGTTMYIRMWEYNNDANGQFGICVSTPDNDDCATAQQICDLNGYGGITSSAYTIDFPSNMTGTGQNGIPNSNPTAPFGQGYIGISPVQIDNNSWLKFTASATTATLFIQVNSCSNGNGMQMQIFSGLNCTNFIAVSPFLETTTSQSITASGLIPGNDYYIMVDGFAGDVCSYTISATSGVQVVTAITTKPAICLGDTATVSAQTIGAGPFTYSWSSTPSGASGNTVSLPVAPTQNTLYTVNVTGQCGSITTANIFMTVNPIPTANITASDTIVCQNETVNLNGNPAGGISPYTHSWTGTGQPFLNTSSGVSPVFSSSTVGNYNLIYEVSDPIGCSVRDSISVTVNTIPIVNITGNLTICNGDTTTLTATGGGSYSWNTGSSLDSIVVTPTTNTNYNVVVTSANNCKDSTNVNVQVNSLPVALILGPTIICQGNSTTLVASGGTSYLWNNGATTPTINVSPIADSTYSVTVLNGNGCTDTTSIFVQVLANPIAIITGNNSICLGTSTLLTASGGGTYLWNNGATSSSINMSPIADTTYFLTVDIGGCTDTASYSITVNPLPVANVTGNNVICNGESTTLYATGGGSYSWNTGGNLDSIIVSPSSSTNYTVIITDNNSCIDSANINIQVNPLPVINITGNTSICSGSSTLLTASGGTSYLWNTADITSSINVNPTITTNYSVVGTSANGCSDSIQITVTVLPQPIANISGINTICFGESTTLIATGGGTYNWNTLDTSSSITVTPNDTTAYTVIVNIGGCIDSISYNVDVTPLPSILALSDTTIILGQSANIIAQGNGPFTWSPTDGLSCTVCTNPTATPEETTTYCASSTENNCTNSSCIIVYVDNICGDLFVPNAFSPNSDGENDCLKVYSNCLATVLFRVYSRWGELIYESSNIDGCWDGTNNGSDLNTGVYTYTVQATLINSEEIELKGNVTLFK